MFSQDVNEYMKILFYVYTERGLHCPKNKYHDKSFKICPRSSLKSGKAQILKCNLYVHFKGPYFAEMINPYGISIC